VPGQAARSRPEEYRCHDRPWPTGWTSGRTRKAGGTGRPGAVRFLSTRQGTTGRAAAPPPSTSCCTPASGRGGTWCARTNCGSGTQAVHWRRDARCRFRCLPDAAGEVFLETKIVMSASPKPGSTPPAARTRSTPSPPCRCSSTVELAGGMVCMRATRAPAANRHPGRDAGRLNFGRTRLHPHRTGRVHRRWPADRDRHDPRVERTTRLVLTALACVEVVMLVVRLDALVVAAGVAALVWSAPAAVRPARSADSGGARRRPWRPPWTGLCSRCQRSAISWPARRREEPARS
jgi:hypothetical protein